MTSRADRLFIGVGGHVLAIDAATGTELWRAKLKGRDVVTVRAAGRWVFGATRGELFCLDSTTGDIRWHNRLKGLGTGIVAFGGSVEEVVAATRAAEEAAAAAAAG